MPTINTQIGDIHTMLPILSEQKFLMNRYTFEVISMVVVTLLIYGCASIPISTMGKMATYDVEEYLRLDPAVVRLRITSDSDDPLVIEKAKLTMQIIEKDGKETNLAGALVIGTEILERNGLSNVRYDLKTQQDYTDIGDYEAGFFDFCIVDGVNRLQCVESAIPLIKSGGFLFLDNSDHIDVEGERRKAVTLMTEAAAKAGNEVEYFTDFAPTQLHANQGLLVRL